MSASLVGSEMCIRDRFRGVGATREVVCKERRDEQRFGSIDVPSRSTGTVSYTHLTLPTICSV
eukprot:313070-Alexandrium_andersonii.AAC.1